MDAVKTRKTVTIVLEYNEIVTYDEEEQGALRSFTTVDLVSATIDGQPKEIKNEGFGDQITILEDRSQNWNVIIEHVNY